ncbi:DUF4199 domain-containing protein [Pontibacter arcticus]|uniref:DUF4199 domain-containing protein n=1 Tax=Pontibacter arcticus TaxID=2080288 RepID=A0A364RBF7_9BACT|nr:DUF4199 domain-containing protein [Pontibacter arcticus]RAU81595.1 DUF4199 domain-containing protein [Pontibacter arcticus]
MFNQSIVRVGVRYGVLGGLACFVIMLLLYFLGANPFGDLGRWSYVPLPVFIFLAIRYFKKFDEAELGFGKGFRVGLSVAFYAALCASLLVFLLIYIVGPEILQTHIAETKALLAETEAEQIRLLGAKVYNEAVAALESTTPTMQAADDFVRRIFVGGVFSLVAAVFFRK